MRWRISLSSETSHEGRVWKWKLAEVGDIVRDAVAAVIKYKEYEITFGACAASERIVGNKPVLGRLGDSILF
jgi:hypothetical protein